MRMSKYIIILALALTPVLVGCKPPEQKVEDNAASGAAAAVASPVSTPATSEPTPITNQGVAATAEPEAAKTGTCGTATITNYDEYKTNIGDRVHFAFDRSDLNAAAREVLDCQAAWLSANGSMNVRIEGHCDERGTREYNIALGERRANAVKNYLVAKGVEASRINTISFGKERPEEVGMSEESWRKNRRGVTVPEGL